MTRRRGRSQRGIEKSMSVVDRRIALPLGKGQHGMKAAVQKTIDRYLEDRGLRMTRQRRDIIEAVFFVGGAFHRRGVDGSRAKAEPRAPRERRFIGLS